MGMLAGWPITVTLVGDESLSARPMRRVTEPLSKMGARFVTSDAGTLPVTVHGSDKLSPISYDSPVASAQVKTALLLAGLRAAGGVRVSEPSASRDHTERLLPAFGVPVKVDPVVHAASLCGPVVLRSADVDVPRDPSSAAFMVCAAVLVPGSRVTVPGVSLNETRVGFLRVLERMGAAVSIGSCADAGLEPVGSIVAAYSPNLACTTVTADEVPSLVDEIPILASGRRRRREEPRGSRASASCASRKATGSLRSSRACRPSALAWLPVRTGLRSRGHVSLGELLSILWEIIDSP